MSGVEKGNQTGLLCLLLPGKGQGAPIWFSWGGVMRSLSNLSCRPGFITARAPPRVGICSLVLTAKVEFEILVFGGLFSTPRRSLFLSPLAASTSLCGAWCWGAVGRVRVGTTSCFSAMAIPGLARARESQSNWDGHGHGPWVFLAFRLGWLPPMWEVPMLLWQLGGLSTLKGKDWPSMRHCGDMVRSICVNFGHRGKFFRF